MDSRSRVQISLPFLGVWFVLAQAPKQNGKRGSFVWNCQQMGKLVNQERVLFFSGTQSLSLESAKLTRPSDFMCTILGGVTQEGVTRADKTRKQTNQSLKTFVQKLPNSSRCARICRSAVHPLFLTSAKHKATFLPRKLARNPEPIVSKGLSVLCHPGFELVSDAKMEQAAYLLNENVTSWSPALNHRNSHTYSNILSHS